MRFIPNILTAALGLFMLNGLTATVHAAPTCNIPSTGDSILEGRRTFMRLNCYSCHSANGHGGTMGPSLVGVEGGDVQEKVLYGADEGMPPFKAYLCNQTTDIANLKAYLQTLGTKSTPTFTEWWVQYPTR